MAGRQSEDLADGVNQFINRSCRSKRTKVAGSILGIFASVSDHHQPGIGFFCIKLQISISLVILETDVKSRGIQFNHFIFQHQRFQFRMGVDTGKVMDVFHQAGGFGWMAIRGSEILQHTVVERFGFSYIDHFPVFVFHQIDAGCFGQLLGSHHQGRQTGFVNHGKSSLQKNTAGNQMVIGGQVVRSQSFNPVKISSQRASNASFSSGPSAMMVKAAPLLIPKERTPRRLLALARLDPLATHTEDSKLLAF